MGLDLGYLGRGWDLKGEDVLITWGLEGIYGGGIPVGRLDKVVRGSGTGY